MLENILPISKKLANLAQKNLSANELDIFVKIVNQLFIDLEDGHSCSELILIAKKLKIKPQEIRDILEKSQLVASYDKLSLPLMAMPLSYWNNSENELIYITRYLAYEYRISNKIKQLMNDKIQLDNYLFEYISKTLSRLNQKNGLPNKEQLQAIEYSCRNKFSIITGGPGTGKTTTVTLLLWALYQLYGNELKIKICAPTGKAAIRVRDSIMNSINRLATDSDMADTTCFDSLTKNSANFGTIHKLLGTQKNNIYFRHNHENLLSEDVLIIDESSMIGLPLFSKLLDAINQENIKHIVFLGDKNQLSSVEEGYVFASLVNLSITIENPNPSDLFNQFIKDSIARQLIESKRNQYDIANLATAILNADKSMFVKCLESSNTLLLPARLNELIKINCTKDSALFQYLSFTQNKSLDLLDVKELFNKFNMQANLCLTNNGVLGANNINKEIERKIKLDFAISDEWYSGRPIMILQNDYALELFNGDIGICIIDGNQVRIIFESGKQFIPEILPNFCVAYAITIHKSQGSEYQHVNVVIPETNNSDSGALISRELLYTGVTRAKLSVKIFSDQETIFKSIDTKLKRITGLPNMF